MNDIVQADNRRVKIPVPLFVIYTFITLAVYILPNTKLTVPYIISGSLMLISLPVIMLLDRKYLNYGVVLLLISSYFLVVHILRYPVLTDGINEVIRNVRFFIPILWGAYGIRFVSEKQKKAILILFFLLTAYILYNTMVALEQEPWIARILAQDQSTSSDEVNAYRLGNVGGYPFSYMIGVVAIMVMSLTLKAKKAVYRIIGAVLMVVIYIYIVQTMYTTLLLLTTSACLILLLVQFKSPLVKLSVLILFFVIAVGFVPLLELTKGLFDSGSLLVTKFEQIIASLTGEGIDALGRRPQLMAGAISNWLSSQIVGMYTKLSAHSLILDFLQSNGLMGFALWIVLFVVAWKLILTELKMANVNPTTFNVAMTYFTVLSFFNDTKWTFDITIAAFFIVPIFCCVFFKNKKSQLSN